MDFLKRFFNFRPPENTFGPTGLPQDVENDLRSKMMESEDGKDLIVESPIAREEFHSVIQNFDQFFKEIFNDINTGKFQVPFSIPEDLNKDDEGEKDKQSGDSLRNKMLDNQDDENDKKIVIPPFFRENHQKEEDSFNSLFFNWTPFFQHPRQDKPFKEEEESGEDDGFTQGHKSPFSIFPFFSDKDFVPDNRADNFSSAFKYSTVIKKVNPDGSVETTKTRKDSDGNVEETVTRTIDGQTHTVEKKQNKDGDSETRENYINMHEQDLQKFEEKWKEKKKEKLRKDLLISSPNYNEEEV